MKKVALTAMALVVSLGLTTNAVAADKDRAAFTLERGHMDSKDLIGMKVETPDGKRAGKIDRLVFDMNGKVTHVIIGTGGVVGVGKHDVAVPWSEVKIVHDGSRAKDMVATVDRSVLDRAPRYVHSRSDRDRTPAASPATSPRADRDRDGVPNRTDRAPSNPNKY